MPFRKLKYNSDTAAYTTVISLIISVALFLIIDSSHAITWNLIGIGLLTFILKEIIELIFFE